MTDQRRAPALARAWSPKASLAWPRPAAALWLIIAGFCALRLACAWLAGLGSDESYTVAVARDLGLSYFDHPPVQYWLAHAMEPLAGVGRGDRAPFIALFAASSWLMFRLTARLFGEAAGLWATLALNLAPFFTVAAGGWVLPDGPLDCALLAAAAVLAEIWFAEPDAALARRPLAGWILAGLCLGLAGLSKYQAALTCLGLGLFLISTVQGRRSLASPGPYLAAVIVLAVMSPVIVWNAQHGWVSFAFQAGRGAPAHVKPLGPVIALAGQLGLLAPWIFVPLAMAAVAALRAGPAQARGWLCAMLALPAIVVFTLAPLSGAPTLPHWSMPGWLMLFPLLGERLAAAQTAGRAWPRRWALASLAFVLVVGGAAASDAASGWAGHSLPRLFRHGDPTVESVEWTGLREPVARALPQLAPGAFIGALKWNEAGKVDQAAGDLAPVVALTDDARQYRFRHPAAAYVGHDALIIGRLDLVKKRLPALSPYFRSVGAPISVSIGRDGDDEIVLGVVEARDLLRPFPQSKGSM